MPYKSADQRKAMHAAAKGKSTIGIPKKAARKFIRHSKSAKSKGRSRKGD